MLDALAAPLSFSMTSVEKVTLTVAAICHDVGHPGRNNQFFVNCYDPLVSSPVPVRNAKVPWHGAPALTISGLAMTPFLLQAVIYNDVAVLENFHSCLTFRTLELKDCNIFQNLDDSVRPSRSPQLFLVSTFLPRSGHLRRIRRISTLRFFLFFPNSLQDFRFVRQNIIDCILATDMKQHFESVSRFRVSNKAGMCTSRPHCLHC